MIFGRMTLNAACTLKFEFLKLKMADGRILKFKNCNFKNLKIAILKIKRILYVCSG